MEEGILVSYKSSAQDFGRMSKMVQSNWIECEVTWLN